MCEKMNVDTQQVLLLRLIFCLQNVSDGTDFNLGFEQFQWGGRGVGGIAT